MPQLRALYLPHISHSTRTDRKEFALQVLDIVSIRPDLKITYVGVETKCYQILEGSHKDNTDFDDTNDTANSSGDGDDFYAFEDHPFDDGDVQPDDDDTTGLSDDSSDDYDTDADENKSRARFRIQEILFYDDKISIFKARHGAL